MSWGEETEHVLEKTAGDCDREYIHELRAEVHRLRAMLPQKVEGLPTKPGWYWVGGGGSPWEVVEVQLARADPIGGIMELAVYVCGVWFPVSKYVDQGYDMYGPLTPPDQLRGVTEMI